ncbi:MAG: methyltransferase domain-containing protein [Actinomycetota bacterium]|nr:methyltransferase domain-containing protein [Actinomycetota bacterium]
MSNIKRNIASSYEAAAPDFTRYADEHVYRFLAEPLAASLRSISGVVLDIASGSGALARRFPNVVALDISLSILVLNDARDKVQADAEHLPFPDDSFAASASAFGINHFPSPERAVQEMARVSPLVALITWKRPEADHAPGAAVFDVIERHCGRARSRIGEAVEEMTTLVGSEPALEGLLSGAGLGPTVSTITASVPWPGAEEFVDYRLSMLGALAAEADLPRLRSDAVTAVRALPPEALTWEPRLVLGLGRRPS